MGPEALAQVLRPLAGMFEPTRYPDLLRGLATPDDAAVWRLDAGRALVLTADFFPPVVDDAYDFGRIAAANAMSDVWAMGATPLLGINLVGWPEGLDPAILAEVLRGGAEKVAEGGAVIAGGHTTADPEPKYGVAVVGLGHPDRLWTKGGARPGDALFLTKPIGTGVVTTALKRDAANAGHVAAAVDSMARLLRGVAEVLHGFEGAVHAATDVTGFSLAGHGHEMADASGAALAIDWEAVPVLDGARDCAGAGMVPGGGRRNRAFYGPFVRFEREIDEPDRVLLFDPQTAGGLLVAVDAARADEVEAAFAAAGEPAWRIGAIEAGPAGGIVVR